MGEKVAEFEKDFATFVGSKYAVMTSSGSTANLIATAALFYTKKPLLKRGDEVIVPAVSWSTTYYPLFQYFLKNRRENARHFVELFKDNENFIIQKEIGQSSWFGFSFIIKPECRFKRKDILNALQKAHIEYRPIVTGNFTQNEVIKYFDYEIFDELKTQNIYKKMAFLLAIIKWILKNSLIYLPKFLMNLAHSKLKQGLWLPSATQLTDEQIAYICEKIAEFYKAE